MPDDYNLPRHGAESSRLDAQHDAYVKIIGFVLHPRIKAALPPDARIADIGTGTGVWLQALATTCPATWSLHGFDVSDAQFPHHRPGDRITFSKLNITEPIPSHLRNTFDVVHLRLLVCGLMDPEWLPAAQNALHLLKPGGWIQWHESQFCDIQVYQNVPGASTAKNQELLRASIGTLNRQGKMLDNALRLCETVREAGFEDCCEDVFSTERVPEVKEQLMEVQFGAIRSISRVLAEKDPGFPMSTEELEVLLREAEGELEGGKAYFQWNMRVVTGRKPR